MNLKDRIAETIHNCEYNQRYGRIEYWGAYQFATAIVAELEKETNE